MSTLANENLLETFYEETLEEIDIQGRESFINNGGENFDLIPCLNDNDDHIQLLKHLIHKFKAIY